MFFRSLIISLVLNFIFIDSLLAIPNPVIFVHGIGDSSVAWKVAGPAVSSYLDKYYKTPEHPYFLAGSGIGKDMYDQDFSDNLRNSCVYITFKDHFADPSDQVQELKGLIEDTRAEVESYFGRDTKVDLVTFSMGGLTARKYLTEHPQDHGIGKLILLAVPNLGSRGLLFLPPLPIEMRGVKWNSKAVEAMKEGSEFIKKLNSQPMPVEVEYIAIISDTTYLPHFLINKILFYGGGDGAIAVESQKLSEKSAPNFKNLNYKEFYIDSPHFQCPFKSDREIIKALNL